MNAHLLRGCGGIDLNALYANAALLNTGLCRSFDALQQNEAAALNGDATRAAFHRKQSAAE